MDLLSVPEPVSAGVFLSYRCNSSCRHCMYACSPRWEADWLSEQDAEMVLSQLAGSFRGRYSSPGHVGLNHGLHFTGGEPFLNFGLLLRVTEMATQLGIRSTFVETNCLWCRDDATTRGRLEALRAAGLQGVLISANPFVLERVPFERTERAARIGEEVFGSGAMVYQRYFFGQFRSMGLRGTLSFGEYMQEGGHGLFHAELLPLGRFPYRLAHLYESQPASHFLAGSCRAELTRDWHVHIDNYCNFVPGYCGGISLGDSRELQRLCQGIDLGVRPVVRALLAGLGELRRLASRFDYEEPEGYISKCHLCLDIRRHLVRHGEFAELAPLEFYEHLED